MAGLAHTKNVTLKDFQVNNVFLTEEIVQYVKKFSNNSKLIFFSSSKVYGEESKGFITETEKLFPETDYGISKKKCEELIRESSITYISLRPSLIIGKEAKGNLLSLKKVSNIGVPLPSNISNKRSVTSLEYIKKVLGSILEERVPWNSEYNVADLTVSTSEIFKKIGISFLIPYPKFIFKLLPVSMRTKLLGDFAISNKKISEFVS